MNKLLTMLACLLGMLIIAEAASNAMTVGGATDSEIRVKYGDPASSYRRVGVIFVDTNNSTTNTLYLPVGIGDTLVGSTGPGTATVWRATSVSTSGWEEVSN